MQAKGQQGLSIGLSNLVSLGNSCLIFLLMLLWLKMISNCLVSELSLYKDTFCARVTLFYKHEKIDLFLQIIGKISPIVN